jgi:hypothetical protein
VEAHWKLFERLVAAIQQALATADAKVTWDDHIRGRQFDVTVRFSHLVGEYLTVVEAKDYLVPVGEVEAFSTKSRRYGANKAVMASSAGFQSGAIEAAAELNIELFVFSERETWPNWVRVVEETPVLAIADLQLLALNGAPLHRFPNQPNHLSYHSCHTIVRWRDGQLALNELIDSARKDWDRDITDEPATRSLKLPPNAVVKIPFCDPIKPRSIRFMVQRTQALGLDTRGVDPSMLPSLFSFKNVLTGEEYNVNEAHMWIGFKTDIVPGRFYHEPLKAMNYYCVGRSANELDYVLLESYQHGNLFQAAIKQALTGRTRVVQVTDEREINRLQRMYNWYRWRCDSEKDPSLAHIGKNAMCPCGSARRYKSCHGHAA